MQKYNMYCGSGTNTTIQIFQLYTAETIKPYPLKNTNDV